MTFINPLMLAALAAASIPLLLHLLNRRKGRTIEIPTLRFLTEMRTTRLRAIRIRRLLLLLLRLGVVFFTVLGFAGPVISEDSAGMPGDRTGPVVILLDDSWSVHAGDEGEERWERQVEVARKSIRTLENNHEYSIVLLSRPGAALDAGLRRDGLFAEKILDELRPSFAPIRYGDGLEVASRLLDDSPGEILLISDLEENNLLGIDETNARFSPGTTLHVIDPGRDSRTGTNLSIDTVRFRTQIPEPGGELIVEATLRVHGHKQLSKANVSLWIDGRREETVAIDLDREEQVVSLRGRLVGPGAIGGYVEVSGDQILEDNRYYFGLHLVDNIRVAVIAEGVVRSSLDRVMTLAGQFSMHYLPAGRLPTLTDREFSTLLLVDPSDRIDDSDGILSYVEEGGGLVLFAGPRLSETRASNGLLDKLGISVSKRAGGSRTGDSVVIAQIERSHPLFEGVFDQDRSGRFDDLVVRRTLSSTSGESVVTLASGDALVSDLRLGEGRIVYVAVPPTSDWSTITRSSLFVPLVVRSLLYTSASGGLERVYRTGEVPQIRGSRFRTAGDSGITLSVLQPSGRRYTQQLLPSQRISRTSLRRLEGTGLLEVSVADQVRALYGVNGDPTESRGRVASRDAMREALLRLVADEDDLIFESAASILPDRGGLQLWQICLLIAIACALAELVVGRGVRGIQSEAQESVAS